MRYRAGTKVGVFNRMKEGWERSEESKPGHRFQDRYLRCQRSSSGRVRAGMIVSSAGGIFNVLGVSSPYRAVPGP